MLVPSPVSTYSLTGLPVCSGLGVGTSATAMMRHNISTTLVEIDETVYEAARKYFALPEPEPGKLILKDARRWLRERASGFEAEAGKGETTQELYDYVIHDVFSGGSLPSLLFTQEFWNNTKEVMKRDGVLAVVRPRPRCPHYCR